MNELFTTDNERYFEQGGPESIDLTPTEKEAEFLKEKQAELGDAAFWEFLGEYLNQRIEAATQTGSKKKCEK